MAKKIIGAWILGIILSMTISFVSRAHVVYSPIENINEKIIPTVQASPLDALDLYIEKLVSYECTTSDYSRCTHLDVNGKTSTGCLQFQRSTFDYRSSRYGIQGSIEDCAVQKAIAKAWFKDDQLSAAGAWYTSIYVRGLGLPTK